MRVGVDATGWTLRRGYGRFERNALGRLIEIDPQTTYVFYVGEASAAGLPAGAERRGVPICGLPVADETRRLRDSLRLMQAVRRDAPDAFVFPAVYTYFPIFGVPTVLGVHDLIATELGGLALPTRLARLSWRLKERLAVRGATVLFTVSKGSRAAIARRFAVPADEIAIVRPAADPVFRPRSEEETAAARADVGLRAGDRYFVYAAGISPHKRLDTLVDAFAAAASSARLVVAGDLDENRFIPVGEELRARVARLGLTDRILLPGFVPDDRLAALYTGAVAAVVPSCAEGFGLPAVEAAACGAAVILSDLPPHRESLGAAALYFPPGGVAALRARLERVLEDEELRRSLAEQARTAVACLSWDAAAERLRELVRTAVASRRRGVPGAARTRRGAAPRRTGE
jgi:glycosyltransferase involved in cell wall biosynthesis